MTLKEETALSELTSVSRLSYIKFYFVGIKSCSQYIQMENIEDVDIQTFCICYPLNMINLDIKCHSIAALASYYKQSVLPGLKRMCFTARERGRERTAAQTIGTLWLFWRFSTKLRTCCFCGWAAKFQWRRCFSQGSVEHSNQMMKGFIHTKWQQIDSFPATVLWSPPLRTKDKTFSVLLSHMY